MEYICDICNRKCKSLKSLSSHKWKAHTEAGQNHKPTKGKKLPSPFKNMTYESIHGPEKAKTIRKLLSIKAKETPHNWHLFSEERKQELKEKASRHMREIHASGRGHNIGKSRWNNEPSWPERFFMQVIDNEFEDKNYEREKPFYKFSLDFVWEHKKKVIEIDGEQHERFEEQRRRDLEKDTKLYNDGYVLLRIKWKDMYNNPKKWIEIANKFIGI